VVSAAQQVENVVELRPELCECGHPLTEHADSGWGPNTVCFHVLPDPDAGMHGVCPCVRYGDEGHE